MKSETRTKPPKGWEPPSGTCECGCGQQTTIAKSSNPVRGFYAGYPRKFVRGHHMRLQAQGEGNNAWKGGRTSQYGYLRIRVGKGKYEAEHRMIWEKSFGPIPRGSAIHHINGDTTDNRLENLVCVTRSEHNKLHLHGDMPHYNHVDPALNTRRKH